MEIEQLIISIQKRPKMFVKEERIDYIYYLLSGYCGANHRVSGDEMDKKFCVWFGEWLERWITDNIDVKYSSTTAYWYDDIKMVAKNAQDAVTVFYDLCRIFFEDYKNNTGYFS